MKYWDLGIEISPYVSQKVSLHYEHQIHQSKKGVFWQQFSTKDWIVASSNAHEGGAKFVQRELAIWFFAKCAGESVEKRDSTISRTLKAIAKPIELKDIIAQVDDEFVMSTDE